MSSKPNLEDALSEKSLRDIMMEHGEAPSYFRHELESKIDAVAGHIEGFRSTELFNAQLCVPSMTVLEIALNMKAAAEMAPDTDTYCKLAEIIAAFIGDATLMPYMTSGAVGYGFISRIRARHRYKRGAKMLAKRLRSCVKGFTEICARLGISYAQVSESAEILELVITGKPIPTRGYPLAEKYLSDRCAGDATTDKAENADSLL